MKVVEAHKAKQSLMSYSFFERGHIAVVTEGLNEADVLGITKERMAVEFEVKVSRSDLNKELAAIKYATMTMKEGKQLGPVDESPEQEQLNLEFAGLKQKAGGWSKISKHEKYINPKAYFEKHQRYMYGLGYIPNYFYIACPRKLTDYAMEQLKGTGYGVIAFDGCRSEGNHYGWFKDGLWFSWDNKPEDAEHKRGAPCTFGDRGCYQEITVRSRARLIHKEPITQGVLDAILNRAVNENIKMLNDIVIMEQRIKDLTNEKN